MLIRYQGFRPSYQDVLYKSGAWRQGEVKDVPPDMGAKLLRHPDVYVLVGVPRSARDARDNGKTGEPVETVERPPETTLEDNEAARLQNARDIVNSMTDKQAVADFAMANYQHELSRKAPLEKMKLEAIRLIDLHGLP